MSCIYGPRQMGTEDQGWVAHFLVRALRGEPISVYGDGCQVRDVLYVRDAVAAYLAAWQRIDAVQGRAFNLGGGPANAVSLRQVIAYIEALTGQRVEARYAAWRPGDQRWYVSDARRATASLGLEPPTPWRVGVASLARWLREEAGIRAGSSVHADALPRAPLTVRDSEWRPRQGANARDR
jgi:CDP-paratose 2-epimerase